MYTFSFPHPIFCRYFVHHFKGKIQMNSKNILFYLTIVLAFALSGCLSNNELIEEYEAEREISFRVVQTMSTRGVSRPIPDGEPLEFNTGNLYLVNAQGVILRHFRIGTGVAYGEPCNTTNTIGRAELMRAAGVTIESVPSSVTRVVIIGNYGGTAPLPTTGNVSTGAQSLLNRPLNIVSQYRAWNVNLTNCPTSQIGAGATLRLNGNLIRTGTNNGVPVYSTTVHLAPSVARFEIVDITGMGMIQSFTVDGIFMDGFYRLSTIGGTINENSIHTGGSIVTNFTNTSHTTAAALPGALPNAPIGDTGFGIHSWRSSSDNWTGSFDHNVHNPASMVVRPGGQTTWTDHTGALRTENNVWSFQVFAGNYHLPPVNAAAGTSVPRIIIRLSDVTLLNGYEFNRPQFLTIRDFRIYNTNTMLQYIRASRVYRIEAGWLTFDENDLADVPNVQPLDVNVTVTLAVWNDVNLEVVI